MMGQIQSSNCSFPLAAVVKKSGNSCDVNNILACADRGLILDHLYYYSE